MYTSNDLHQQLLAKSVGTPYTVTPTANGLLVHLNVADMNWMNLLAQHRLEKEYSIELTLDEAAHTYSREQIIRTITWTAGATPGSFVPQISQTRDVQRGTSIEISSSRVVGMDQSGQVGIQGYDLDSREMAHFVDSVMKPSGWTKKMDKSTKLGLIFAVGGIAIAIIAVLVVVVIALMR